MTTSDTDTAVRQYREQVLEAIAGLRHAAACNFTPAYSGAEGMARTDSFAEAYRAVEKVPLPASLTPGKE